MKQPQPKCFWEVCPSCQIMMFNNLGKTEHKCPNKIRAVREAELDAVVDMELETWEEDLNYFWNRKDTKFYEYLAKHKKI